MNVTCILYILSQNTKIVSSVIQSAISHQCYVEHWEMFAMITKLTNLVIFLFLMHYVRRFHAQVCIQGQPRVPVLPLHFSEGSVQVNQVLMGFTTFLF